MQIIIDCYRYFNANGHGISIPSTRSNLRTNEYFISADNNTARFSMWYANSINGNTDGTGSINNTISCSGRPLNITEGITENQIMILLHNRINDKDLGSITCKNATNTPDSPPVLIDTSDQITEIPLVDQKLMVKFFIAAIIRDKEDPKKHQIIPITYANAGSSSTSISGNFSFGIKLGILLRSRKEVFNVNKNFTLDKILNVNDDNFKFTAKDDRFLYKLIIIQSPFSNNLTNNPPIMTTNIRQISTAIP